jgi:hypothetical protein
MMLETGQWHISLKQTEKKKNKFSEIKHLVTSEAFPAMATKLNLWRHF